VSTVAAEAPLDVGKLWRAARLPILIVVVALALVALLAAVSTSSDNPLDPRSTAPSGTHALAVLLDGRGVSVAVPDTSSGLIGAARSGETVVLADPGAVSLSLLHALASTTATVLLVGPENRELGAFGVPATLNNITSGVTPGPGCALPAATVAGSIEFIGDLYATRSGATGCYRAAGDAALVVDRRATGGRTVVLGGGSLLSNADLGKSGNAALALGLLSGSSRLQWLPPGDLGGALASSDRRGLFRLLPSGLDWGLVQLAVAVIVLALWRARRLGRPVVEPLPVVVRAAETVEGNARLLHAANARATAAAALRTATRRRVAAAVRLDPDVDPAALVSVVAEHTGQPAPSVHALLYGADPRDDPALVGLAGELEALEAAVRQQPGVPTGTTSDPRPGGQQ
jgi:hypothetical protein